ncbi:MAG TPA: hypothetical protein VM900_04380 [Sphingomonas sp.]|jgi:hypothetical protein|nr:hypothetical protein [Sphingomonas sp.]
MTENLPRPLADRLLGPAIGLTIAAAGATLWFDWARRERRLERQTRDRLR